MSALFLREEDVRELMDMEKSIQVIENAFRQIAANAVQNVPRARAAGKGVVLHTMSASVESLGLVGWKAYTTTPNGARFHVAVYDAESGEMVALIEANTLGQLRTGAASGVATEFMARPDAKVVGVFGSGWQARSQLKAVCTVRRIERVEVYSRDDDRRREFAEEMSEFCATEVKPVHTPEQAAAEKDIVITATTSPTPVFDGRALDEGTHLNVIGSNFIHKAEIDVATVRRANHIVCDNIEQCRLEAGDFTESLAAGVCAWEQMHELAEVVAGRQTGRATAEDVTLFKSVGIAVEDVAMAAKIIELAKEAGLGEPLPF
ncbi:MAG: ornithine cyclodeaminase family protein [Planctomycetes bacterium]|nr:ornithine cyclodeaminase family protein [Planctomycetota bacterium]